LLQLVLKLSQTCFLATTINYWDTVGHMVVQKTMNTLLSCVLILTQDIKPIPHLKKVWVAVVACLVMAHNKLHVAIISLSGINTTITPTSPA
jgi:hypothetical protein